MGRVLVITGGYSGEHAKKDLPLVGELRRRGHQVTHVVIAGDVPLPFPRALVESDPDFRAAGSLWFDRLPGALPYLRRCDVLLIPIHKGVEPLYEWAHRLGKVVIQHDNHGGYDSYYHGADLVAMKGPYFADFMRHRWNLAPDSVVSTGSVQFDRAVSPEVPQLSRDDFCHYYNLDPSKRIAAWLPTRDDRQAHYAEWTRNQFRRICETVLNSSNHNLIIKLHPVDQSGPAPEHNTAWWREWFPNAAVCRREHGYTCYSLCDVGIANWSSTGIEFPIFRKPFLYVDVDENPRFQFLRQHGNDNHPIGYDRGAPVPGFVGRTCKLAELPDILEQCSYVVEDQSLYDEHIARFLHAADGRAFERVADLVDRGLAMAAAGERRPAPAALPGVYAQAWASELRRLMGRAD